MHAYFALSWLEHFCWSVNVFLVAPITLEMRARTVASAWAATVSLGPRMTSWTVLMKWIQASIYSLWVTGGHWFWSTTLSKDKNFKSDWVRFVSLSFLPRQGCTVWPGTQRGPAWSAEIKAWALKSTGFSFLLEIRPCCIAHADLLTLLLGLQNSEISDTHHLLMPDLLTCLLGAY